MSSPTLPPLEVEADAQVPPELLIGLMALIFLSISWLVAPALVPLGLVAAAITVSTVICHRAGWLTAMYRIRRIHLSGEGTWLLTDGRGETLVGQLRADSRLYAHILWLRWDTVAGGRQALIIRGRRARDSVRRLTVRVRFPSSHGGRHDRQT